MQFKALYLLALLMGFAAASPVPHPQGGGQPAPSDSGAPSADGVSAIAGESAGKLAAATLPKSSVASGIGGAGGEPGPGQENISDNVAAAVGAAAKAADPAFADGAVRGAGGKPKSAGGAAGTPP